MNISNPIYFNNCVKLIRNFFSSHGFIEIQNTHNVLDINKLLISIDSEYKKWNLGQIWMEDILLNNKNYCNGYFSITNDKKNNTMFEFTAKGDFENLININKDLLQNIGFKLDRISKNNYKTDIIYDYAHPYTHGLMGEYGRLVDWSKYRNYDDKYPNNIEYCGNNYRKFASKVNSQNMYRTHYPEHNYNDIFNDQGVMDDTFSTNNDIFLVKNFPNTIFPYWNIAMYNGYQKRVDAILYKKPVISSVEKSCDKAQMRHLFNTIIDNIYTYSDDHDRHDGHDYAKRKKEIDSTFDKYIEYDFFPRYGGKIDINNMIRAMIKSNHNLGV